MQRNQLIDTLRGFAMIVMILTHTTVFFLQDKLANFLWNWSHFAVPIFVFCSVSLFLQKHLHKPVQFLPYLKKRVTRLLLPYYYFLLAFIACLFFIKPDTLTTKYIVQSFLVIGGVDINWLVLLFVLIIVILPFFTWSFTKNKTIFWTFFVASLGSTIVLLFISLAVPYKFVLWLPWSLMLFVTLFYLKYEQKKKALLLFFLASGIVFVAAGVIQNNLHHSLTMIDNKYPPNLFYLSYGIAILFGLILIEKYLFNNSLVMRVLNFFSKFSYSMYFIHYLILTILATMIIQWHFTWYTFFFTVLVTTVITQMLITVLQKKAT